VASVVAAQVGGMWVLVVPLSVVLAMLCVGVLVVGRSTSRSALAHQLSRLRRSNTSAAREDICRDLDRARRYLLSPAVRSGVDDAGVAGDLSSAVSGIELRRDLASAWQPAEHGRYQNSQSGAAALWLTASSDAADLCERLAARARAGLGVTAEALAEVRRAIAIAHEGTLALA
jgi:hypothetical protein